MIFYVERVAALLKLYLCVIFYWK